MITIRFSGRMPSPREIPIGQETDQAAEKLRFRLPEIAPGQIATLQLIYPDGTSPDAITIEDGVLTVPASLTEQAGRCRAWVEILADNTVAWHSELLYLDVGELPPISEETERAFPTAFQQAIAATLGNKQAAETAAQEAEIAAAIAKSAQGQITVTINGDGDLIVTYEDTEGETHDVNLGPVSAYSVAKKYGYQGTEAEWEQNVASVGVNAAAAAESAEDAADSAEAAETAKTAAQAAQTAAETAAERDVTAWLDEHAQTAQIAVIDNTLSIEGAAAEAKVTGDELRSVKSALSDNQQELGFAVKNFSKIAGSSHPSTTDKLDITIKSGQEFYVTVSQTGSVSEFAYQLFAWHNGVSTRILNAQTSASEREITASSDYEQLSVYVGDDVYAGSAEMKLLFETDKSKLNEIETLKTDMDAAKQDVSDLEDEVDQIIDVSLEPQALLVDSAPEGWRLLDTGLCTADSSAKLVKYKVDAGKIYKIVSDDKAQFQTVASVPSSGSPNRVGVTYGVGTFYAIAPSTATYLIISTYKTGSTANAYQMVSAVPNNFFTPYELDWIDGKAYTRYGEMVSVSGYSSTAFDVSAFRGETVSGTVGLAPDGYAIGFLNDYNDLIVYYINSTAGTYKYSYSVEVPSDAATMFLTQRNASADLFVAPSFTYNGVFRKFETAYKNDNRLNDLENLVEFEMNQPLLRNGSIGNGSNANMVSTRYVIPINHHYRFMRVDFILDETLADAYAFVGCLFKGSADGMTTTAAFSDSTVTKSQFNQNATDTQKLTYKYFDVAEWADYDHVSFAAWRSENGTAVPIRIANDPRAIRISYFSAPDEYNDNDALPKLKNARHIKGNTATPLTLLHFSDLHKDTSALARIISEAKDMGTNIDDAICTGDIVANSAEQIASWWDESVMTCIGNHDSASHADGVYNWTALSMANRDAYYIAPFESNWDVVHTSGTSYYYKDYATQKVRLIVMDVMLYNDNGAEATAQTAWLSNLLSSAITNNLHVLIAIHAPHGGAVAEACSFSRYGQTAMPTLPDCNTPQTVIDAVAAAINNGLHFIGYLVGHTHQDNIWDAEGDGKQLMYCVTCAIVSQEAQWKNSDQYRGTDADAYNLVTIDTANTLVKIIRGGGADIDDHMRTRKAICFNYSTGEKAGEVL